MAGSRCLNKVPASLGHSAFSLFPFSLSPSFRYFSAFLSSLSLGFADRYPSWGMKTGSRRPQAALRFLSQMTLPPAGRAPAWATHPPLGQGTWVQDCQPLQATLRGRETARNSPRERACGCLQKEGSPAPQNPSRSHVHCSCVLCLSVSARPALLRASRLLIVTGTHRLATHRPATLMPKQPGKGDISSPPSLMRKSRFQGRPQAALRVLSQMTPPPAARAPAWATHPLGRK